MNTRSKVCRKRCQFKSRRQRINCRKRWRCTFWIEKIIEIQKKANTPATGKEE